MSSEDHHLKNLNNRKNNRILRIYTAYPNQLNTVSRANLRPTFFVVWFGRACSIRGSGLVL